MIRALCSLFPFFILFYYKFSFLHVSYFIYLFFSLSGLTISPLQISTLQALGWSGGAMALDKRPVPGRPYHLDKSRTRAYCSCSRCAWGLCGHFFSRLSFHFSVSLSLEDGPI